MKCFYYFLAIIWDLGPLVNWITTDITFRFFKTTVSQIYIYHKCCVD
jgi:hypothetical protein